MNLSKICSIVATAALTLALMACGDETATKGKASSGKSSMATITFENGEILETRVICNLESQIAAGQEILYTATSVSNPYFDITVFGEKSSFTGASVSWMETKDFKVYQVSWSSDESLGRGAFSPTLEGKTITGKTTMVRGEDETGQEKETRQAEIVVKCK